MKNATGGTKGFNSARIVRNLEDAGMDRRLAGAVADALHDVIDYVLAHTVTREEFADFKAYIQRELRLQLMAYTGVMVLLLTIFEMLRG